MTKEVARSLTSILENPLVGRILDPTEDVIPIVDEVLGNWNFDLYKRKPGPAYTEDGIFVGTDLDLATFMYALADRKAVINLPKYQNMRPSSHTEGVNVIHENRHGQILGITPNKTLFSFSARMMDMNVSTTDKVGEYRNFALTDPNGKLYAGWSRIEFTPTAKENNFLNDHKIWTDNKIIFSEFIHPNRWVSFYGKHYIITKLLLDRLSKESKYYYGEISKLAIKGFRVIKETSGQAERPETTTESGKSQIFKAFEVEIDVPEVQTSYPKVEESSESLTSIVEKRNKLIYTLSPKLRFFTRSTEYAFYKFGGYKFPAWIQNAKWEEGFKVKSGRKEWNRLVLFQPVVGQPGVAIRCREFDTSEIVSSDYVVVG